MSEQNTNFMDYLAKVEAENPVEEVTTTDLPDLTDEMLEETSEVVDETTPTIEDNTTVVEEVTVPHKRTPDEAMRDYRVKAEEAEKQLNEFKNYANSLGMTVDELKQAIQQQIIETEAERTGKSVQEVQLERASQDKINLLESEVQSLRNERLQEVMVDNLISLEKEFNINSDGVKSFITDLIEKDGFSNEMLQNLALNKNALHNLYKGKNAETLFEKKRQELLQKEATLKKTTPMVIGNAEPQTPVDQLSEDAIKLGRKWAGIN